MPSSRLSREWAKSLPPVRYSIHDTPSSDLAIRMGPSGEGKIRYTSVRRRRSARRDVRRAPTSSSAGAGAPRHAPTEERSEEHTSELQSHHDLVCRLLLEKKKKKNEE